MTTAEEQFTKGMTNEELVNHYSSLAVAIPQDGEQLQHSHVRRACEPHPHLATRAIGVLVAQGYLEE
jgi:hypothetical protein